jgi:hypothetical protein
MKLGCTRSEVRFVEKSESWGTPNQGTQILATIPAAVDRVYRASSLDRRIIWNFHDPYLTVLDHDPTVRFPRDPFRDIWNKPTCSYFEPSSYTTFPLRIVFVALYEAWRHGCGEYWNPEYGHFIANPVKSTERGPKTLGEITQLHQEICAFAKEYEPEDEKYRMHRSYPQVLLVCDRLPSSHAAEEDDGSIKLKKVAQGQTVLVVKSSLSKDISFDGLASHALPLERSDVEHLVVMPVPLSVAVDFVIALEIKMGEPQGRNPNRFDTELCSVETPFGFDSIVTRHPATWAAAMTAVARNYGNDSMNKWRWPAMRIAAGVSGQPYELEQDPWREDWNLDMSKRLVSE